MGVMTIRSTYALDADTAGTIKRLAKDWNASQAEVIRRSVRLAAEQHQAMVRRTPAEVLEHWRKAPPKRTREQTQKIIAEMGRLRHLDDLRRTRHHAGKPGRRSA
ncbi:MAG: hypothetical protein JWR16_1336 [Nevskia sp.]|nr:hypothetical protein [Nevskia sp.]